MSVYIENISGLKELDDKLQKLEAEGAKKAVMNALMAGAPIMYAAAKELAPVATGKTKGAIKVRKAPQKPGRYAVTIGVGAKDYTGETFYAAFVNWGHHLGKRKRKSAFAKDKRRWVPGEHWLEAAFEESASSAVEKVVRTLGEELEKIISEGKV